MSTDFTNFVTCTSEHDGSLLYISDLEIPYTNSGHLQKVITNRKYYNNKHEMIDIEPQPTTTLPGLKWWGFDHGTQRC